MAKQSKSSKKSPEKTIGSGKVTPVQVAFIVDRYLSDNNFTQTRSIFRTEASSLLTKTQLREAPKSLLSLGAILDEYICLKEQKLILDQERCVVEQEKARVETLLHGMKDAMNVYNASATVTPSLGSVASASASKSMVVIPQSNPNVASPSGNTMNKSPATTSLVPRVSNTTVETTKFSMPSSSLPSQSNIESSRTVETIVERTNFSTPSSSLSTQTKRKSSRVATNAPHPAKRARGQVPSVPTIESRMHIQAQTPVNIQTNVMHQSPSSQSASINCLPSGNSVQKSAVGKCLFKQPSPSLQSNSASPKTPPQAVVSPVDKSTSPAETSTLTNTTNSNPPQDITPPNCPVIPSKVSASPMKHVAYFSREMSHYISCSPNKKTPKKGGLRDHVKGRLDFGVSDMPTSSEIPMPAEMSMPGSNGETDLFDELPNLDLLGNFSLSEYLADMDFDSEQVQSPGTDVSGSSFESGAGSPDANQPFCELQSTVTEVLCHKDLNIQGSDNLTSVTTSVTKCITITSPAKNRKSPAKDQENLSTRN